MEEFEYKVSIIVPIYNVEKYLRKCLDSLLNQTIDPKDIEILLINDGSTDNSIEICKEYSEVFPVFKFYSKENEGLSATRNYGIERANGKYLMYLDSDDSYSPETVKQVTDFFDTVYDEVDLVTFLDQPYDSEGNRLKPHSRYKYLTKDGVYDLEKYPYIMQTRVNVCVKNAGSENVLFPTINKDGHEDQQYNNQILMKKMKIGYCSRGEYQYNRGNETSIMHVRFYPIYIFEGTTKYYEEMFEEFNGHVPRYFQVMFMHDVSWKLKENMLFPYHLKGEEYEKALDRLKHLMDYIDDDVILKNPTTDNYHRHFFMNWKNDKDARTVIASKNAVTVYKNNHKIFMQDKFEIILYSIKIINNRIKMIAFVKSSLFNYFGQPIVYVCVNEMDEEKRIKQELSLAGESYYHTKEKTNNFYQFFFEYDVETDFSFYLLVEIDGITYPTKYWFSPSSPFYKKGDGSKSYYTNHVITYKSAVFTVNCLDEEKMMVQLREAEKNCKCSSEIKQLRENAIYRRGRRVWLYYDCAGVGFDNGWKQFQHDFIVDDGVERYYINTEDNRDIYDVQYRENVIDFGSKKHRLMYLISEKIFTAYVETENVIPFSKEERVYICDIAHPEIVYLQHGILHAHLPWKYVPGKVEADKIVVSSNFELENFANIYHFRKKDLIPVGMARYDFIDQHAPKINRILFAPSWRNYLIGSKNGNYWNYTDDRFIASSYYKIINEFLNSEYLESVLEKNELFLDFKIHPIFKHYLKYFDVHNLHVNIEEKRFDDASYSIFITDFSSYVFDFGYLKRNIIYFVPDWLEFTSGMNQYRELDLPFEKAFGPLVRTSEDAVREIEEAVKRHYVPKEEYMNRMENFYLPLSDCREGLYRYMVNVRNENLHNLETSNM